MLCIYLSTKLTATFLLLSRCCGCLPTLSHLSVSRLILSFSLPLPPSLSLSASPLHIWYVLYCTAWLSDCPGTANSLRWLTNSILYMRASCSSSIMRNLRTTCVLEKVFFPLVMLPLPVIENAKSMTVMSWQRAAVQFVWGRKKLCCSVWVCECVCMWACVCSAALRAKSQSDWTFYQTYKTSFILSPFLPPCRTENKNNNLPKKPDFWTRPDHPLRHLFIDKLSTAWSLPADPPT